MRGFFQLFTTSTSDFTTARFFGFYPLHAFTRSLRSLVRKFAKTRILQGLPVQKFKTVGLEQQWAALAHKSSKASVTEFVLQFAGGHFRTTSFCVSNKILVVKQKKKRDIPGKLFQLEESQMKTRNIIPPAD